MEATVAERSHITLRKEVRDALGLVKSTKLTIEVDHGKLILRKNAREAINRIRGIRGKFSLPDGMTTDDVMRELRGRAPGDAPTVRE